MRIPSPLLLLLPAAGAILFAPGCVLDRTGQSASENWHREMLLQRTRTDNLEAQFAEVEARVDQLEELTRARGQQEILRMETLDQLRNEVANIRGEVEVLSHELRQKVETGEARSEDAAFRLAWLEARADQIEASLGLEPPPPPEVAGPEVAADAGDTGGGDDTGAAADGAADEGAAGDDASPSPAIDDPEAALKLAEDHLQAGRPKAAEVVLARFIDTWPDHPRIAEARYRYAEAAFNDGRYQVAVLRFQEVIDRHKDSPWAPWAMLRQGECFEKQGQPDNARLFYEDVVRIWPRSKAAKEARGRL
ncbi:MAG: hypothetical protein D6798_10995 [Deltaproteobacteria bacterium]|nr:MAG: hypothetical protein D6798_10995 [Deltaproteobacteria bacterium]